MARLLPFLGFSPGFLQRSSAKNLKQFSRLLSSAALDANTKFREVREEDLWVLSPHKPIENLPEGITMPEMLRASVGDWGHAPAFECAVSGKKFTHNQVFEMSRGFGAALLKSGLKRGDTIGIILQNVPEYASVLLGVWEAGMVASTANPLYTSGEIARQLQSSGAKWAVTSPKFLKTVRQAKTSGECPNLEGIVIVGEPTEGCHTFSEMIKTDVRGVNFMTGSQMNTKDEAVLLPYSSGTTGPPKGVMLTHFNICTNLLQGTQPVLTNLRRFEGAGQERLVGLLPFFHSYGLCVFMHMGLYLGCHTVCLPEFKPDTFLETIRRHKPTSLHLVTPLISYVVNTPDFGKEELSSVRTIVAGAAPVGPSLISGLLTKAGKDLVFQEGYGMTELSPISHVLTPRKINTKIGSCGTPVHNTATKLVDLSTGETLGRNQKGEMCVKGPQVMKGYFNNEEATKNTIDKDGWLHTGDIAYYDNDGYCFIVDRLKELIKVKGFQVAPSELEDLLREHAGIADVAVIGIPNEESGELPRAYIVKKDKSLKSEDVNKYLKDKVTSYKHLHGGIEFVESIPKAPTGKILRRELKDAYKKANNIS